MKNIEKIRSDFKFLAKKEGAPIYFDNACMSLKPESVVSAMEEYYKDYPACGGRSSHKYSEKVTKKVKEARNIIAKFIGAKDDEIIFTRNTTEGINLLVNSFSFKKGDIVLISDKEHNSNLIPWLLLRDRIGIDLKIIPSKQDGSFDLETFSNMVVGARFVSVVHTSNLDGVINPAKDIIDISHKNGAFVFLDCAQSMSHVSFDVKKLDVDFLAFSGHKILGPTGTGVFYGKKKLLEGLAPFLVGGDTVLTSTYDNFEMLPSPEKFEAGLQDYAGIIGLGEAVKYLNALDFEEIKEHEFKLNQYITEELLKFPQIKIIGPIDASRRSGIINFYIENKDMHQFAIMLDSMANISIRSGQHCVHSWFNAKKIKNSARISLYFYNTMEEAKVLIENLTKIIKII